MRPTYLPWLEPGEEVPPPLMRQELTEEGISYAFLDWRNPSWKVDIPPYYVILLRTSELNLAAPGDPLRTTIEGSSQGELYGGKDEGEASVYWVIPNVTSCSTVALWLNAPDMTTAQARKRRSGSPSLCSPHADRRYFSW